MPGARSYIGSDEGRATARRAVGDVFQRFLRDQTKTRLRKGKYFTGALFHFATMAVQHQMDALRNDQRIFTNIAKVRRGDPEMTHLSHNELREVTDHAKKYGGADAEHIERAAHAELERRQIRKNTEWDVGERRRDELRRARRAEAIPHETKLRSEQLSGIHSVQERIKEEQHQASLRRQAERVLQLRTESGHTASAKIAHAEALLKIRRANEAAKTKGFRERQAETRETLKSKAKILKTTKSGGAVIQAETGRTYTVGKERAQEMRKAIAGRGTSRIRRPTMGSRRRRTV